MFIKKNLKIIIPVVLILFLIIFLIIRKPNKNDTDQAQAEPTAPPKLIDIDIKDRPYISLIPRADGHEIKLIVDKIPDFINQIEYELIYTAVDEELDIEIEKGLNGSPDIVNNKFERDLLLGTESCTNGCKYKYDSGVTGGYLILNLITTDNQMAIYETEFVLADTAQVKQSGLNLADLKIEATPSQNQFFILLKNYNQDYSVFSSGNGLATITSIPDAFEKEEKTKLTGDYTKL